MGGAPTPKWDPKTILPQLQDLSSYAPLADRSSLGLACRIGASGAVCQPPKSDASHPFHMEPFDVREMVSLNGTWSGDFLSGSM